MTTAEYAETYPDERLSYALPSPRVAELLMEWQEKQEGFLEEMREEGLEPKADRPNRKEALRRHLEESFHLAHTLRFENMEERREFAEHAARELLTQVHNFPEREGYVSGYGLYAESQGLVTAGLRTRLAGYSAKPGRELREYDCLLTGLQLLEEQEEPGLMTADAYHWIQEFREQIVEPLGWQPPDASDERFMSERYFYDGQSLSDQKTFAAMVETLKDAFPDTASCSGLYLPMSEWTRHVAEGFKTREEVFWMELKGVFDNQEFPDRHHAAAAAEDIAVRFAAVRFGPRADTGKVEREVADFLAAERDPRRPYDQDRHAQWLGKRLQAFGAHADAE